MDMRASAAGKGIAFILIVLVCPPGCKGLPEDFQVQGIKKGWKG
jgi:hypothetical protein